VCLFRRDDRNGAPRPLLPAPGSRSDLFAHQVIFGCWRPPYIGPGSRRAAHEGTRRAARSWSSA